MDLLLKASIFCITLGLALIPIYGQDSAITPNIAGDELAPNSLRITSPQQNGVVAPGETITVSIESPDDTRFVGVLVAGEISKEFLFAKTLPASVTVRVPSDYESGTTYLNAMGTTSSQRVLVAEPLMFDIERPGLPYSLRAETPRIYSLGIGMESYLKIFARFKEGSVSDVTRSSRLHFSSTSSTNAITVDANGMVTGKWPGEGVVVARYESGGRSVETAIPVTVVKPGLVPSSYAIAFPTQAVGTHSASVRLTFKNVTHGRLKVLEVRASGDFSETNDCMSSLVIASGQTCSVNVVFTPKAKGRREDILSISDTSDSFPIELHLEGHGE